MDIWYIVIRFVLVSISLYLLSRNQVHISGWVELIIQLIYRVTNKFCYKLDWVYNSYTQTMLVIWSLEIVIQILLMILKDFAILIFRNVFNMESFEKKNVSWHATKIANQGPLLFKLSSQSLQILGKISSHIFLKHSKFVEI